MRSIEEILTYCDHTLLSTTATWKQIREVCDDGIKFSCASVCIPPSYVKRAKDYVGTSLKICTVIGFPNGYSTTAAKAAEARDAVLSGADEIDMVINLGMVKDGMYGDVLDEIRAVRSACNGRILKVIIETCLLTEEEKIKLCEVVSASGADFIKTSTGFAGGGATPEDVKLFSEHISGGLKIKAAGGISSLQDADLFIELGAERIGTSRIVKLAKSESATGY